MFAYLTSAILCVLHHVTDLLFFVCYGISDNVYFERWLDFLVNPDEL